MYQATVTILWYDIGIIILVREHLQRLKPGSQYDTNAAVNMMHRNAGGPYVNL